MARATKVPLNQRQGRHDANLEQTCQYKNGTLTSSMNYMVCQIHNTENIDSAAV